MFFFAVTSFGCGLAFSFPVLITLRVFQGIASAMAFGTSMAILTSVVPPKERGKAMGSVGDFFAAYNPNVHLAGRVFFHLASFIKKILDVKSSTDLASCQSGHEAFILVSPFIMHRAAAAGGSR